MCPLCDGKGIVRVPWDDAPEDFAVCLCPIGMQMRRTNNNGEPCLPLWRVWCAREQVDPERVLFLEDIATAEQLKPFGLEPPGAVSFTNARDALLATGARKK